MTSPQAIARMVERATRKAAVGRARSAQVRFDGVGIPDLITFPDGSSTPPIFVTHTATLMPGGASPAGLTLPMLVVPLDGGGWVPVAYMPDQAEYLVETTLALPVQTVWQKGAVWDGSFGTWGYQVTRTGAASTAAQGFQYVEGGWDWLLQAAVLYFGNVPALVPSGVTVHAVKLALTRVTGTDPWPMAQTTPYVSGHHYTPSSPPLAAQAPAVTGAVATAAPMTIGATQQIDVWATDLISGAITGLTLGAEEPTIDAATFSDLRLLITYTGGAPSE